MSDSNIVYCVFLELKESAPWMLLGAMLGIVFVIIWPPYREKK